MRYGTNILQILLPIFISFTDLDKKWAFISLAWPRRMRNIYILASWSPHGEVGKWPGPRTTLFLYFLETFFALSGMKNEHRSVIFMSTLFSSLCLLWLVLSNHMCPSRDLEKDFLSLSRSQNLQLSKFLRNILPWLLPFSILSPGSYLDYSASSSPLHISSGRCKICSHKSPFAISLNFTLYSYQPYSEKADFLQS